MKSTAMSRLLLGAVSVDKKGCALIATVSSGRLLGLGVLAGLLLDGREGVEVAVELGAVEDVGDEGKDGCELRAADKVVHDGVVAELVLEEADEEV